MKTVRAAALLPIGIACLLCMRNVALGDDFTWSGTCGDTNWYTVCSGTPCTPPNSWLLNNWGSVNCGPAQPAFPAANDDIHVSAEARLWIAGAVVRNVTVPVGGLLKIGDGGHLTVHGGSLAVDGQMLLHYGGYAGAGTLTLAGDAMLSGGGSVVTDAAAVIDGAGPLHIIPGQAIRGHGATLRVALDNAGLVACDVPTGISSLRDATKTNAGIIKAANGGMLEVYTSIDQSAGGRLIADGGIIALNNGSSVIGGRIESAGTGRLDTGFQTCTLTDVHNLGDLRVGNGGLFIINGATLTNDGVLRVYYSGYAGDGTLRFDAPVLVQGSGEIVLEGAAVNGVGFTQAATHTIRGGSGTINAGFDNNGTIRAEGNGGFLKLQNAGKTNRGLIAVSSGAHLNVSTVITQLGNGRIRADGGLVHLNNGTVINGGAIESSGGGVTYVDFQTATLTDVHNLGDLRVGNGGRIISTGTTLINDGTITTYYSGYAGCGTLQLDADLRIEGTGTLRLDCSGVTPGSGAALTNGPQHTITGGSAINVALTNEGTIAPGSGVGTLPVNANYTQQSTGRLRIELGGVGSYDRLAVAGNATLAGDLYVIMVGGFQPQAGQQFVVVTSGSLSGKFDAIRGTGVYSDSYSGNNVTLTVIAPPGDMNCNGGVNGLDVAAFVTALLDPSAYLAQFPACNILNGDLNGDGVTDGGDIPPFVRVLLPA